MAEMLKAIRASRAQVGDRVRFLTPGNPRGEFKAVGEAINGCEIESFDRKEVTFKLYWPEGKKTLRYIIPRE